MPCECDQRNQTCGCKFLAGLHVTLTGGGTDSDPVVVNVDPMILTALNTPTVNTTITGTGDVVDPYLIRMAKPGPVVTKWTRWVGTQQEFESQPPSPKTLAIVTDPTPHVMGLENLHVGGARLIRAYLGSMMVADDSAGVLGPGT